MVRIPLDPESGPLLTKRFWPGIQISEYFRTIFHKDTHQKFRLVSRGPLSGSKGIPSIPCPVDSSPRSVRPFSYRN